MNKRYSLFIVTLLYSTTIFSQDRDTLINRYLDSAKIYESQNKNQQAYNSCIKAYQLLQSSSSKEALRLAKIDSDMGTYAQRMGNTDLSEMHHRKALKVFLSMPNPDYNDLYLSGNNMGGIMWYASKTDSAIYFFNIALKALSKMDTTPQNLYYRPAVLNNNMSAIYGSQGKTTEAIAAMELTIGNLKKYLSLKGDLPKKDQAVEFLYEATDNLAGIYKELGDYRQAHDLLDYSYKQKRKLLPAGDPAIFKSEILLGQIYYAMREFDKAETFLDKGLKGISHADGDFLFWQGDAYYSLALISDELGREVIAASYYEQADKLYQESAQGDYDDIYLDFLRNASLFYAENNERSKSLEKANRGYQYLLNTQGKETLPTFYQVVNLAEIYYRLHDYKQSLSYSNTALGIVNKIGRQSINSLDSIKTALKKPKAILIRAKAQYDLLTEKNVSTLSDIRKELQEALDILDQRRLVINDDHDINLMLVDNSELLDFTKKILYELYRLTGEEKYIEQLVGLHESALYNRIRARLDKFNHTVYNNMRYPSMFRPLGEIQKSVPANTTIIRYLFVDRKLLAFVADKNTKHLEEISTTGLDSLITSFSSLHNEELPNTLYGLYNILWRPLEKYVHHSKIIIVPDEVLYNLNFEILTPQVVSGTAQLADKSLLAKYTISYRYSLFLMDKKPPAIQSVNNFVAFAPGFSDDMKENYRNRFSDEAQLDQHYLTLLPQPFTVNVASKTFDMLGGNIFTGGEGTLDAFKKNAGLHKIIHIGTHAESNNLQPQFSRLIFAKDLNSVNENNSLYQYEIYSCDLSSDITVLTACESGKAGYEDGEGMISLAHAFNYAGSESILMGLWKIDEQSSAVLIDHFYKNLVDGMSKDEALRQAKLSYLKESRGRKLNPRYWAGLVLMGDIAPVSFKTEKTNSSIFIIAGIVFLILAIFLFRSRTIKG